MLTKINELTWIDMERVICVTIDCNDGEDAEIVLATDSDETLSVHLEGAEDIDALNVALNKYHFTEKNAPF